MARAQAGPDLVELRRQIARLERRPTRLLPETTNQHRPAGRAKQEGQETPAGAAEGDQASGVTGLGPARRFDAGLSSALSGDPDAGLEAGLACGTLHEIASDETRQAGAASGFALALVTRLACERSGAVLWVSDGTVPAEAGALNAEGLARFGLEPGRVIEVRTHTPADSLWALEEGIGCAGLVGVVGEFLQAPRALTLTASRRLALRAGASGVTAFLISHAGPPAPSAAVTRWRISSRTSREEDEISRAAAGMAGLGRPAWHVRLEKNREGRPAVFDLEWDCNERIFRPATHLEPVAAAPFHRQDRPQGGPDGPRRADGAGELIRLRFGAR